MTVPTPTGPRVGTPAAGRLRAIEVGAGILLALEAVLVAVALGDLGSRLSLPIVAGFPTAPGAVADRVVVAALDPGIAALVLLVLGAVSRLAVVPRRAFERHTAALGAGRRGRRLLEYGFASAITLFVVARLNGIADVTSLVPLYAITNGVVLLALLPQRGEPGVGRSRSPLMVAAALGIVPWGVVAFQEVGGMIAGSAAPPLVVALTLATLAAALTTAVLHWREVGAGVAPVDDAAGGGGRAAAGVAGQRRYVVVTTVATSVFAWLIVALVAAA
ncbi:hypothetical protein AS850_12670 [Frondihabitans sp. 762G35]|uniref:hypothetical protein n=1 Tax=Frondihabitans sp. 762G35 TaxID=1446794 RepID=UPI000D20F9EB|nr:hypothetical protein [Frondihabitans sp. 762G35]ARC57930.1 hypothetical protein AS850_12670 [Frondihabitans sp. 762G35]